MAETFTIANGLRIAWRRSARARRMTLRVPRDGGPVMLTLPAHAALSVGTAFAEAKSGWLLEATRRQPPASIAAEGAVLPVRGQGLRLTPAPVRAARIEGAALLLPLRRPAGPVTQAFLRHLAADLLRAACDHHAAALGCGYRALVLRDTRSRWGSCTTDGRLMFSWRLAMAPPPVLDYVAAHEVAHLRHMDHSSRFWSTVETLCPGYRSERAWLRQNGAGLMAWRFDNPGGD